MHVALLSPSWPLTEAANGIVTYVDHMRHALLSLGHEVSVIAARATPSDGVYPVEALRVTQARRRLAAAFGRARPLTYGLAIADTVRSLHKRHRIDVIEMEESFGWPAHVARLGIPTVVKLHGPAFLTLVDEELSLPISASKIAAEGQALRAMRFITAPSRNTLDRTVSKYGLTARGFYVPNPIDASKARVWSPSKADPNLVLFVGRFDKIKGGDRVLDSFKRVLARKPDARLVFAGPDRGLMQADGSLVRLADYARDVFSADELRQVDYRGALPPSEVAALRVQAGVTVIASRWESAGYTAAEAMSQGCPIAAIDCEGVNEVVLRDKTGLISASIETLAEDILLLLSDPARAAELGQAARQFITDTHAPAVAVGATLKVYEHALAGERVTS